MSIEAMKLALEALERIRQDTFHPAKVFTHTSAITALRQAIKQAEQALPELTLLLPELLLPELRASGNTCSGVTQAQPVAFKQELINLLCRIHRDGGHYIAEHGLRVAIDEADIKVAELNALADGASVEAWMDGNGNLFKHPDDADRGQTMRPLYMAHGIKGEE